MIPRPLSAQLARLRPFAVVAFASATACVDTPTSPPQIHAAERVSSSTAPVPIGAPVAVPLPLDNHPLNGIGGRWFQMQTVPGGGFYLIKITGSVTHKYNPACGEDDSPTRICDASLDGVTAGPLDHIGAGYVSLGGAPVGFSIEGGREPWPEYLRPHGGGAAVFVRYDGPATLWARRSIMVGCNWTIWSSCGDGYVPQYFLSGRNQVEVLYVPVPASVEGPAVVAPGQSVTFAGRTVEDYPVDEPYAGYRSIWWTYIEGDTLPDPGAGGAEVGAWNCSYKLSCDFTPRVSGRMRILAYINGYEVIGYSGVVRVQADTLKLACDRLSVNRGDPVTCHVVPFDKLTDVTWAFTDTVGHTVNGPKDAPRWGGPLVISGRISVTANLNGSPATADTMLRVNARRWPRLQLQRPAHDSAAGHLPASPTLNASGTIIAASLADSHLQRDPINPPYAGLYSKVASGPNAGYWYVTGPLRRPYFLVHMSSAWNTTSAWFRRQGGGGGYCSRADVRLLERRAKAHEGSGPPVPGDLYNPSFSHFTAAERYFARENDVNALYERTVRFDDTVALGTTLTFRNHLDVVWTDSVETPHHAYNMALVHTPTNLWALHCKLRP